MRMATLKMKQLLLSCCISSFLSHFAFASADIAKDTEALLDWAENTFPQYFPNHEKTQSSDPWLYRYYLETGVYAGVNLNDNGVYVFGGPWGIASPTYINTLSSLLSSMLGEQNTKLTGIIAITANQSGAHSYALKNDGNVLYWGGTNTNLPVKVNGWNSSMIDLKKAFNESQYAVTKDGQAWDVIRDPENPIPINGLTNVISIATNVRDYYYAIKTDGSVWFWNRFDSPAQAQKFELTNVIDLRVSGTIIHQNETLWSYFALKNDGTVWAWGNNSLGQLGNDTLKIEDSPIHQIAGLSNIIAIDVSRHSDKNSFYALKNDGTVWSWGNNEYGQLGDGTTINRAEPAQVNGLSGVTRIVPNPVYNYILALKSDGTVWSWGNWVGLGIGIEADQNIPVQVANIKDVITIATAHFTGTSYALKNDGTVWAWGGDFVGALGNGDEAIDGGYYSTIPVQVSNLSGIIDIDAGNSFLALRNDGTVWAWGANNSGQIGDGTTEDRNAPVQVLAPQ